MDTLDFSDVKPKEMQVTGLMGHDYVLREAKGDAVLRYQEAELGAFETVTDEDTGKTSRRRVKTAYKIESFLVSLCLFDAEGKPVPQSVVETFQPQVQRRLYAATMEMTFPDEDIGVLRKRQLAIVREIARLEELAKNGQRPAS